MAAQTVREKMQQVRALELGCFLALTFWAWNNFGDKISAKVLVRRGWTTLGQLTISLAVHYGIICLHPHIKRAVHQADGEDCLVRAHADRELFGICEALIKLSRSFLADVRRHASEPPNPYLQTRQPAHEPMAQQTSASTEAGQAEPQHDAASWKPVATYAEAAAKNELRRQWLQGLA